MVISRVDCVIVIRVVIKFIFVIIIGIVGVIGRWVDILKTTATLLIWFIVGTVCIVGLCVSLCVELALVGLQLKDLWGSGSCCKMSEIHYLLIGNTHCPAWQLSRLVAW